MNSSNWGLPTAVAKQYVSLFAVCMSVVLGCVEAIGQEPVDIAPKQVASISQGTLLEQSAISCEPFGAGYVSIDLGPYDSELPPRLQVTEHDGRVFFPVYNLRKVPSNLRIDPQPTRPIGRGGLVDRLRNVVSAAKQRSIDYYLLDIDFLFTGSGPLNLTIIDHQGSRVIDLPVQNNIANRSPSTINGRWLQAYLQSARRDIEVGDYPPFFHTFVAETMARRLQLAPESIRAKTQSDPDDPLAKPLSTLEWLTSTERLRDQIFEETIRNPVRELGTANVPLPKPPQWLNTPVPNSPDDLPIESIAASVPPECFYLRFGSFANYLWFKELTAGKGAGLAQMLTVRGSDSDANSKIERMLNTKMNLMTKLFGDSIIDDMAIIGHDLYLQDGATLGVLLESKNIAGLKAAMDSERKSAAQQMKDQGVQLDTLEIAGRKVTLLSSRDHSIRSFLAVDGDILLQTTSRTLVERFFAVRDGAESLASTPQFRFSRLLLPNKNNYELFAYFSPAFFQNLMSPQRNIELRRRYSAKARIIAAEMATLMAQAESIPHDGLQSLIKSNLLPAWIEDSEDGSQLVLSDGKWLDSRRGAVGAMLPISDVPVLDCTPTEAMLYQRDAEFCATEWKSTEPIMLGIRRFQNEQAPNVERLAIEAYISPLDINKFGKWGSFLAGPINTMIAQPSDDIVSVQAHIAGQQVLGKVVPDNVLFLGLKDQVPPVPTPDAGLLEIWRLLRQTAFYLGAWPQPRYLDMLPLGLGGSNPGIDGFSRALIGMWRWQGNGFSLISFDRSMLEHAITELKPVSADDPAQLRVRVQDLENTALASWMNQFWYSRSFAAARGNLRLLDGLQQLFRLTPVQAMATTTRLLDTKLVSPIGGEYKISSWHPSAMPSWNNDKLSLASNVDPMTLTPEQIVAPESYRVDWIGWMRGLQAHLTQTPESLVLLATIDLSKMESVDKTDTAAPLPKLDFDLFKLPSQLFGGQNDAEQPPEKRSF